MPTIKTWFDSKTYERRSGTESEYWRYKIKQLLEKEDLLNDDYFDDCLVRYVGYYEEALKRENKV